MFFFLVGSSHKGWPVSLFGEEEVVFFPPPPFLFFSCIRLEDACNFVSFSIDCVH